MNEDMLAALEANIIVSRRIYEVLLVLLHEENPKEAERLDRLHNDGEYFMADIVVSDNES